ncbi:hypothetical protein Btru_074245 [Bulinus truncatus]|nr:hypothetical protein Btru_074245 [Bulinus truncatus]
MWWCSIVLKEKFFKAHLMCFVLTSSHCLTNVLSDAMHCLNGEYLDSGKCQICPWYHKKCSSGDHDACKSHEWFTTNPCTQCKICHPCGQCGLGINLYLDFEVAPCSTMTDTVCCEEENMDIIDGQCMTTAKTTTAHVPGAVKEAPSRTAVPVVHISSARLLNNGQIHCQRGHRFHPGVFSFAALSLYYRVA